MLYPDLRRLSLAHACPTGMPLPSGTHNHEAGGSNDPPPPPPPPQAGPAQEAALGMADVVAAILRNLGGGNYRDACRVAARWCGLNSEHRAACQTHQPWTDLTQAVFPGTRAPDPRNHEPEHPRDWFFYLCDRHARLVVLEDLVNRIFITEVFLNAQLRYDRVMSDVRYLEKRRALARGRAAGNPFPLGGGGERRLLHLPSGWGTIGGGGWNEDRNQALPVKQWMIDDELKKARRTKRTLENAVQHGAITWATREDPARWVGELAQLDAYMRGLYPDTN